MGSASITSILFVTLITTAIASLIPLIVGAAASDPEHDLTFKSYFNRPNANIYFTDEKLIEMRNQYTKEYKSRLIKLLSFVLAWVIMLFILQYDHLNHKSISDETATVIGVMMALSYIIIGSYLFAITAASDGRLEATKPLNYHQKNEISEILAASPHSDQIISLLKSNPKIQLAQIDYLHVKHTIRKLDKRKLEDAKKLIDKKL